MKRIRLCTPLAMSLYVSPSDLNRIDKNTEPSVIKQHFVKLRIELISKRQKSAALAALQIPSAP